MAVQGKGILGNPKGVIGSINCITRLGQGIIQKRATVANKYDRYKNLWLANLKTRLATYWNLMYPSGQLYWSNLANLNETGEAAFYRITLESIFSIKGNAEGGSFYQPSGTMGDPNLKCLHNLRDNNVYITLPYNGSFWQSVGKTRVILRSYFVGGGFSNNSFSLGQIEPRTIILPSNIGVFPDLMYIAIEMRKYSPSLKWSLVLSGAYDQSFF